MARSNKPLFLTSIAVSVLAISLAAQAQTISSPFARKSDKPKAWETQTQSSPAQSAPPAQGSYVPPRAAPRLSPQAAQNGQSAQGTAAPPRMPQRAEASVPSQSGSYYAPPQPSPAKQARSQMPREQVQWAASDPYAAPVETLYGQYYRPVPAHRPAANYAGSYQTAQTTTPPSGSSLPPRRPTGGTNLPPRPGQPQTQIPPQPKSWQDRLGLNRLKTTVSGYLKLGAAGTDRDTPSENGWREDFIVDGSIRGEVSAITQGGLEYGLGAEVRGQYDKYRRGFGGRVGDCAPTLAGCPSVMIDGVPVALRGHTSQFYAFGPSDAKEAEIQLEGAYLFLRSAYGDVTLGRDDGAAYLFSLGAPSLLAVGASNSPVDYTGLDAVKTVNDASGFAEKITYTSPRLLGDTVGVGVQFGASYAPDATACGVDYCVRDFGDGPSGAISPNLKDIFELGVALDRTFANGLSIEATGTYAMGSEQSGSTVFDDLQALGLGAELGYGDWTLGGSYLDSNNGLADGDYTAWDAGVTWQPSQLGFTLGYGEADDDNIGLSSKQGVFGVTYDFNDRYRLGTGVQYIDRDVTRYNGGLFTEENEKATSVFVEGRVTF